MILVTPEPDDKAIEARQREREKAQEHVGTEEPVIVPYFPSFDAAKAALERRNNQN